MIIPQGHVPQASSSNSEGIVVAYLTGRMIFCLYNLKPYLDSLERGVDTKNEILTLLEEILSLNGRAGRFNLDTPLLGAIPELDSMAVVALITGMEDRFGFVVDDDEIEGSTFATLGSLIEFVNGKLAS